MNHREPTSVPPGTGQALPCLALLLLPLLALNRAWSRPNLSAAVPMTVPGGYLIAVGAPSLRFQEATPPPDLVMRPPASAPPKVASGDSASRPDVLLYTPEVTSATVPGMVATEKASSNHPEETSAEEIHVPPPILRDELQHQARPEDVLPYFQIPAQGGNLDVIVPVPRSPRSAAPLPQSSATYTQSPK